MITPAQMRREQIVLSEAYIKYKKGLLHYVAGKIDDAALTDDLVQNTFLKTWAYILRGGKVDVMEAFLFHVLKALIIDEYRKRKSTSLDVLLRKGFEPAFDETKRLADTLDGKHVVELIEKLPVAYRKIMHMRYVQDLSLREISLITGQSRNTVAVQTHRGLKKLKLLYVLKTSPGIFRM
jgi:RNA polymerase sigma-70 factor, ECF subfamily